MEIKFSICCFREKVKSNEKEIKEKSKKRWKARRKKSGKQEEEKEREKQSQVDKEKTRRHGNRKEYIVNSSYHMKKKLK